VNGIEQMTFTYGVFTDASRHPTLFLSADDLSELADETIDGETYSPWERVVSVRACVLVRSFSNTELAQGGVGFVDCNNQPYSPPTGVMVRRFTQTFGIKNRLTRVAGS
jgi:type IV pilus assembly protein PilW